MSEQTAQTPDNENQENPLEELTLLKERARMMGISVSGNIGVDTLKKRIEEKMNGNKEEELEEAKLPKSKREMEQDLRRELQKEQLVLLRCRIYNLNPQKRDLQGEIVTVGNRYLGTVRKFIPFGEDTENGYHIPRIIYEHLKTKKFQSVTTKAMKGANQGQIQVSTRMVPEYNIEILPQLTKEELEELALKQAAAERLGSGD